jgi:hypothetical protein
LDRKRRAITKRLKPAPLQHIGQFLAVVALVITAILLIYNYWSTNFSALKIVAVSWALIPPFWFLIEWWCWKGVVPSPAFEKFKYSQERAKDVWVAIGAILAALYLKG